MYDAFDFVSVLTGLVFGFVLVVTIQNIKKNGIEDSIAYIFMSIIVGIMWIAVIVTGIKGLMA